MWCTSIGGSFAHTALTPAPDRAQDWLKAALYRLRHRPVQLSASAWQRLTAKPSPILWVLPISTPLRYSTEFFT